MNADMNAIAAEAEKKLASSPVVVEMHTEERVVWLLSFGGSNPTDDQCIELTKEQCFWLKNKLASSNYVPLQPAPASSEPVAWMADDEFGNAQFVEEHYVKVAHGQFPFDNPIPLYTTPQPAPDTQALVNAAVAAVLDEYKADIKRLAVAYSALIVGGLSGMYTHVPASAIKLLAEIKAKYNL